MSDVKTTKSLRPRGDGAHQGPLARIPVSAASEHRNDTAAGEPPDSFEQTTQRIVGVRKIDQHRHIVGRARHQLHPPRNCLNRGYALLDRPERNRERCTGRRRRKDVVGVTPPNQPRPEL